MILGAIGVVFGDIGTSPIYTVQTIFSPDDPHPIAVTDTSLMGAISLVFWSVMTIVTLTYVVLVMRADNRGEGGIMALITRLASKGTKGSRHTRMFLVGFGLAGASLFFGDSMITPAISVLSAVEGVGVVAPSLDHLIIPIAVAIIAVLFTFQRFGTEKVGRAFGPVMILWFLALAALGINGISQNPEILKALSPTYAFEFVTGHFGIAFFALGSVVLAVTGAEALYADMGHFGRSPIRIGWVALVLPALTINYMGQGALILGDPETAHQGPFFLLGPEWSQWPVVVLATMATVIASQAVITGAYSVTHQAIRLGYLPRLRVLHTSVTSRGQIYVPWINWLLMFSVITLILVFEHSAKLAFAYGVAVMGTITATTLLFFYFSRQQWRWPLWVVIPGGAILVAIDLLFLSANLIKLFHGAWLPLVVGGIVFLVMMTWKRGLDIVAERRDRLEGSLDEFIDKIDRQVPPLPRTPGVAVFLDRDPRSTPLAMRALVKHMHALPERVIVLTLETSPAAHLPPGGILEFVDPGQHEDGIVQVTVTLGYMDVPDVPKVMRAIDAAGVFDFKLSAYRATFFLSHVELHRGDGDGMPRWQKALFVALTHISSNPAAYFRLPQERAVILGSNLEI
ncbi:MAG: KUP/HAK/KT family potassium transporter [Solirubrobacterales bacterium]